MASHRDSASERLKRTMENWKKPLDERQSLIALDRKYGLLPEPAIIDWNDPARRAAGAVQALLLTSGDSDELLRKAFDAFGLDPANPFNWRALLWAFAHAHFAPPRKKGAPKQWDNGKWCRLLSNFGEVKASSRADASDTEVCNTMKKRYKKEYSTRTSATLRRNLQFARDPQHNGVVAVLQERYAKLIRDAFIAKGNPTTSISAETINEMAIEMAVKALESAWKPRTTARDNGG